MRKILAVIVISIAVLAIAGVSFINSTPDGKVRNGIIANYCSEMTRSFMKSPSSYELQNYEIKQYAPTKDEINDQLKKYKSLSSKDNAIWSVFVAYESYSAKNPMGVELIGDSKCEFMRVEIGTASMYSAYKLSINGKSIGEIDLMLADADAENKVGKLSNDITFMQKLNYRMNSFNK